MTTTNTEGLKPCPICKGAKWVREDDLCTPFYIDDDNDCAGKNCLCNPNGDFPDDMMIIASVNDDEKGAWIQ